MMKKLLLVLPLLISNIHGKTFWISFNKLAPTQMNVGFLQVLDKSKKIRKKYNDGKLEKYLKKKKAPAYIASNGRYYIVDRHHTSRGLYEASTPYIQFPVTIEADLSHLKMADFFKFLQTKGLLYLYDRGIGPLTPEMLPETIMDMDDDPYRSLAWLVRENGGFEKVDYPYLEFHWADFLRKNIELHYGSEAELKKVLPKALNFTKSKSAKHLPGYQL